MITNILEYYLSNHYFTDNDNRFLTRIKNAKLLNSFANNELANKRFKLALYSMSVVKLSKDKSTISPIAITFGNLFFKENGKLQKAIIEIDNERQGNVYVAVIRDNIVVTLILLPATITNQEIVDKIEKHDNSKVKQLISLDGQLLNLIDSKRPATVIDLDATDAEFVKHFPLSTTLGSGASWNVSSTGISQFEFEEIDKLSKLQNVEAKFSIQMIDQDKMSAVKDLIKEWTIAEGQTLLVPYTDGPKEKTIKKIIIDDKGATKKYSLEFEKTLKVYDLVPGQTKFIISPKTKNDKYFKLLQLFGLTDDQFLNFEGKISSISFYKKDRFNDGKPRLGILIEPKGFF